MKITEPLFSKERFDPERVSTHKRINLNLYRKPTFESADAEVGEEIVATVDTDGRYLDIVQAALKDMVAKSKGKLTYSFKEPKSLKGF